MRLLITGATGYFGRHLIPTLLSCYPDIEIMTLNRDVDKAASLFQQRQCQHRSTHNLCDSILEFQPEVVFHLATLSTSRCDDDIIKPIIEANVTYGIELLSALSKTNNLKLFVNVGSFAEYRLGVEQIKDAYLYTATKSAFRHFLDFYADSFQFKYLTVVPYTVYGGVDKNKKIIDYIIESINSPVPIKMTKGEQCLDFIHIDDVVNFFVQLLKSFSQLETFSNGANFYLGTGIGTTIRELANQIELLTNQNCNIRWGGIPYRPLDVMKAIAPLQQNSKAIDWEPKISLKQGLEMMQINK